MTVVEQVREVLASVTDPEIPVLTIADLGILRDIEISGNAVTVTITPTYSGCPAMAEIRDDIASALAAAGWTDVHVETVLSPAWTTDWLTDAGRKALQEHGIAPPTHLAAGPVPLTLGRRPEVVHCPQCGSAETVETSRYSGTSCKALRRCTACREPFEHLKTY